MTTLMELIEKAQSDLATYKHPNISEVQNRLYEIIGHGKALVSDPIESISVYDDYVEFTGVWSTRGCLQYQDYSIPMSVITAEDPVKAMRIYDAKKNVTNAYAAVGSALSEWKMAVKKLDDAENALYDLREELNYHDE